MVSGEVAVLCCAVLCCAVLCCGVACLSSGCVPSTPDLEAADPVCESESTVSSSEEQVQQFDFGATLASGRILRHSFRISNPSDRPIRLLRGVTSTPCCSAIGPLPTSVPPGGEVQVPTVLKTEGKSGQLLVGFAVETDSPKVPIRRFAVSVSLLPEWEVEAEGGSVRSLSLGRQGKVSYKVICRRKGAEGLDLPARIHTSGPIRVFLGEPIVEANGTDGIIEATRRIELELYPTTEAGHCREELVFQWDDGRSRSHVVAWEVRPVVSVIPSGFVIQPSKEPKVVALSIASEDRPIRIVKVEGPLVKPLTYPSEASRRHRLNLLVDTSRAARDGLSDIRITTDHPVQSIVTAAILIGTSGEGRDQ